MATRESIDIPELLERVGTSQPTSHPISFILTRAITSWDKQVFRTVVRNNLMF